MRISDGSSDVCSSDLTGLFQDRPRRAPAASQNQLTRPGARAEGPTLLAECTLVSTEGPGFCGDSGCSSAPRLQRSTDPVNLLYPRSEAHTSELQSLMRNSYAVFCLKTKNTYTDQSLTE